MNPVTTGDALTHYDRHAADLPAIGFCFTAAHAQEVAAAFRAAGRRARCVHGGTSFTEVDASIAGPATGETLVLTC